jgi:hypothetical protein
MKVLISGRWLSFLSAKEGFSLPEDVLFDSKEIEAEFKNGLFTAKVDGVNDDRLVPYWGESIIKEIK